MKHRERLYKAMNLEVAMRNPQRLIYFLKSFSRFENQILNDSTILQMYAQLYIDKVIKFQNKSYNQYVENKKWLIENLPSIQSHNGELGYPTGYQGSFVRYFKALLEFGFIYAPYNGKFEISEIGHSLLKGEIDNSEAFALQVLRHWRKNPYKRVLNDFNYFKFILDILNKHEKNRISYNQFIYSLFSDDGDVDEFLETINENKIGSQIEKCYNLLNTKYSEIDAQHEKIKDLNTVKDYSDVVFRTLRITGFISIGYNGILLINKSKKREKFLNEISKLIKPISEKAKEDPRTYFEEIGSFDRKLFNVIVNNRETEKDNENYIDFIPNILSNYSLNKKEIIDYLLEICDGRKRDTRIFKFIESAPLKLEFLLTLYMYCNYKGIYKYKPNFKCDDNGIPYEHAPGEMGDIEIFNEKDYLLLEATLIQNKTQQLNNETINLIRHIDSKAKNKTYLCLVAPYIHSDTSLMFDVASIVHFTEFSNTNFYCMPVEIKKFININESNKFFEEVECYTRRTFNDVLEALKKYKF